MKTAHSESKSNISLFSVLRIRGAAILHEITPHIHSAGVFSSKSVTVATQS